MGNLFGRLEGVVVLFDKDNFLNGERFCLCDTDRVAELHSLVDVVERPRVQICFV